MTTPIGWRIGASVLVEWDITEPTRRRRKAGAGPTLLTLSGPAGRCVLPMRNSDRHPRTLAAEAAGEPRIETVKVEEDDRRRVKRQRLAHDQPADDRIAERLADLRAGAGAEHQR